MRISREPVTLAWGKARGNRKLGGAMGQDTGVLVCAFISLSLIQATYAYPDFCSACKP